MSPSSVLIVVPLLLITACCKPGKNLTRMETIDTEGEAHVEVQAHPTTPAVVRSGPGSGYAKIATLPNGTSVTVVANARGDNGYWSSITWSGGSGWIHQDVVHKGPRPAPAGQPVAVPAGQPVAVPAVQPVAVPAGQGTARASDGLPVDIPRPGSTPPTHDEWRAVSHEITLYGSSALGCETKMLREWLRVSCRPKGGLVPISVAHTARSGQQAYVYSDVGRVASVVVQVVRGKEYTAAYTFQEGRERFARTLVVEWPAGWIRPGLRFVK